MRIGILALQGAFIEHKYALDKLGVESFEIRQKRDIEKPFDALIIPGGESTVIGKLLHKLDLFEPIRKMIEDGMPVWGTCAGLILLAKNIVGEDAHLGLMDMTVRRNAYGRQSDSFETSAVIAEISEKPLPLVFIRAPWVSEVYGEARVLCEVEGHIAAVRQGNMLATSFHPELTDDLSVLDYFTGMCR